MYFNYIVNKMNSHAVYVSSTYGCNESVCVLPFKIVQFLNMLLERLIWNETNLLQNETKNSISIKTYQFSLRIKNQTNLKFRLFVMWLLFCDFDVEVWAV